MSDEHDPHVSRRYRELGGEEPPRALDEAILAAARDEARARPAPLVTPAGRRRWYFPLAATAVIMLSVVVTLNMQREPPGPETPAPQSEYAQPDVKAPAAEAPREPPAPRAAVRAEARKPVDAPSVARDEARAAGAVAGAAAESSAKVAADAETPERLLERIAGLRREGRHREADELYAEFKRRYPDYRIPEATQREIAPR